MLNETLKLPSWIDLGKIRGAWSKVGNGLNTYTSNPLNSITKSGSINFNSTAPFAELKPEMTTSIEFGTEWRFSIAAWSSTSLIIRLIQRINSLRWMLRQVHNTPDITSMPVIFRIPVSKLC